MDIDYTDGQEIESRILGLIQKEPDRGSHLPLAYEHYESWPVQYHLCPERANLVRPFHFQGLDVLELGAGMGAVSRYLAEQARSLYIVEGTEARFQVLCERLRDLKNWQGEVGNFQDFKTDRKFDVVCMVGVLEYSELFLKKDSPHLWLLEQCRGFLKPGGVLLLAIENALGLKYWSGSAEDHLSTLFDGIVGYPDSPTARTFSQKELKALLGRVGFTQIDTYYPFPDYKIPTSIFSESLLSKAPQLCAELATTEAYRDYLGKPTVKYFPNTLAAEHLARAGILGELSNSFLLCASVSDSAIRRHLFGQILERSQKAWHFSRGRKNPTVTIFEENPEGKIEVRKECQAKQNSHLLSSDVFSEKTHLQWHPVLPEEIHSGESLRMVLARLAYFQEHEEFYRLFLGFLRWAAKDFADKNRNLRGNALDAIYLNARIPAGEPYRYGQIPSLFSVFDQEWSLDRSFALSWFVFRNVCNLVREETILSSGLPYHSLSELYEKLCSDLGIEPCLNQDMARESALQSVTGLGKLKVRTLQRAMSSKLNRLVYPRVPAVESRSQFPLGMKEESRKILRALKNRVRWIWSMGGQRVDSLVSGYSLRKEHA